MNFKIITRRIIAFALIITMSMSLVAPQRVYAMDEVLAEDLLQDIVEELVSEAEVMLESKEDAKSKPSAGDWRTATKKDHMAWNAFHNAVQKDIDFKYESVEKEFPAPYEKKDKKGNIIKTINGRVDIAMKISNDNDYLFWEIKPYSYSVNPNKKKGEEQLSRYIAADMVHYSQGTTEIASGTTEVIAYLACTKETKL